MGLNYYLIENECKECGRYDKRHIGKSSAGWNFSLRVYPKDDIHTFDDWERLILGKLNRENRIIDEYNEPVGRWEMIEKIAERSWKNGLNRYDVDGTFCIGNGDGTYDYFGEEFS